MSPRGKAGHTCKHGDKGGPRCKTSLCNHLAATGYVMMGYTPPTPETGHVVGVPLMDTWWIFGLEFG